jgi:hypothetical protein
MKTVTRSALCVSIVTAMLAACGGSQPPIGAQGAMQAALTVAGRSRNASGSYSELIYAGTGYTNRVYMFTYPAGAFVESFSPPGQSLLGMCTGNGGNIYTVNAVSDDSSSVSMYAYGASQPTWTKNMDGYRARSCAVNPLTGNLAIYTQGSSGEDEIAIYPKTGGGPVQYVMPHQHEPAHYFAYDGKGPLYASVLGKDRIWRIARMCVTCRPHYSFLAVNEQIKIGQLQWVGSYFAASKDRVVYHLSFYGSGITVSGKTVAAQKQTPSWIEGSHVMIGAYGSTSDELAFWHYPKGGKAFTVIQPPDPYFTGVDSLLVSVEGSK